MCWEEDSTVLAVAVVGVYLVFLGGQASVANMSLSGGAFLHSHAKAMTHQTTSASVCDGRRKVAGCDPCVRMPVL